MSFQIQHSKKNSKVVAISNEISTAKIALHQGASIQELMLNSKKIIQNISPLSYEQTYASSILFPFTNRIKDGKYTFDGIAYQTEINHVSEQNALHGFVYDKEFYIVNEFTNEEKASILLEYNETKRTKGFPFTYTIQLEYVLTNTSLVLHVKVKNTSNKVFPFTLGWHPYFVSSSLYDSTLKFDSNKQVVFDERMITEGAVNYENEDVFEIIDKKLDDCFFLNSNTIEFITPHYKLDILSSNNNDFLQVYTPPKDNTIAIEPTTGVSNSFNNEIGLKTLNPNEDYEITWQLHVTSL